MIGPLIFLAALVLFVVLECRLILRIEEEQRRKELLRAIKNFPKIAVKISVSIGKWMEEAIRAVENFGRLLAQLAPERPPAESPRGEVSE